MPLGRKVDGGSNYKCSDFEDRERILERITMNITFEDAGCPQNENRKISMISLGITMRNFASTRSVKRDGVRVQVPPVHRHVLLDNLMHCLVV